MRGRRDYEIRYTRRRKRQERRLSNAIQNDLEAEQGEVGRRRRIEGDETRVEGSREHERQPRGCDLKQYSKNGPLRLRVT